VSVLLPDLHAMQIASYLHHIIKNAANFLHDTAGTDKFSNSSSIHTINISNKNHAYRPNANISCFKNIAMFKSKFSKFST
jgi:hypothetical protein